MRSDVLMITESLLVQVRVEFLQTEPKYRLWESGSESIRRCWKIQRTLLREGLLHDGSQVALGAIPLRELHFGELERMNQVAHLPLSLQ